MPYRHPSGRRARDGPRCAVSMITACGGTGPDTEPEPPQTAMGAAPLEGVVDHSGVDRQSSMGGNSSWPRGGAWSASAPSLAARLRCRLSMWDCRCHDRKLWNSTLVVRVEFPKLAIMNANDQQIPPKEPHPTAIMDTVGGYLPLNPIPHERRLGGSPGGAQTARVG